MQNNRAILIPKSSGQKIPKSSSLPRSPQFQMIKRINEKDACIIEVPFEMSCVGNIEGKLDGQQGTVLRVFEEDATVLLSEEKEIVTVPLFCIKKRNFIIKKREEVENNSPSKSTSKKLKQIKNMNSKAHCFSI
eukprot:gene3685-6499_t